MNWFKHKRSLSIIMVLFFVVGCSGGHSSSINQVKYNNITEIRMALSKHQAKCSDIISFYLKQIYTYNLSVGNLKPPLNAISQINPDIFYQADELDKLYAKTNKLTGSLFCVPVIVKDNIDTLGMQTASGSYSLIGSEPLQDAVLVSRLKSEGAIIIAKSAMDELAMGASGFSSLSGRIGNAYDTSQSPGGSSGGSAAAIAADFAIIGIGSDNSGSVRIPAAFNGLYSLRPTQGLVSRSGVFPMGNLDGTPGPMARSVTDLALSLNVIGPRNGIDYTKLLSPESFNGKTIAVLNLSGNYNLWSGMPDNIKSIYLHAISNLKKSGAKVIQLDLPKFNNDRKNNMAGTLQDVNDYLRHNLSSQNTMQEMCKSDRMRVMGDIKTCLRFVNSIPAKDSIKYNQALNIINSNQKYVTEIMHNSHIDGILLPISKTGSTTYDLKQINTWQAPISSNSGLPSIVIQIGRNQKNMPVAMEIIGDKFAESELIGMAYAYEQRYFSFIPPDLISSNYFDSWEISRLNNLFRQIGKQTYLAFIQAQNKNEVTPYQSYLATIAAIKDLN